MKYENIILDKFVFINAPMPESLSAYIWNLNFVDTGIEAGEVRYKIQDVNEEVRSKIISFLSSIEMDYYLLESIKEFHFDVNRMQAGEYVPMHNEVSQKSPFEIVIWLTRTDVYEGREFVMKGPSFEKSIKPKDGDICFLDTTQEEVYHGVNKLITDTQIISITGGLGRKLNVV